MYQIAVFVQQISPVCIYKFRAELSIQQQLRRHFETSDV